MTQIFVEIASGEPAASEERIVLSPSVDPLSEELLPLVAAISPSWIAGCASGKSHRFRALWLTPSGPLVLFNRMPQICFRPGNIRSLKSQRKFSYSLQMFGLQHSKPRQKLLFRCINNPKSFEWQLLCTASTSRAEIFEWVQEDRQWPHTASLELTRGPQSWVWTTCRWYQWLRQNVWGQSGNSCATSSFSREPWSCDCRSEAWSVAPPPCSKNCDHRLSTLHSFLMRGLFLFLKMTLSSKATCLASLFEYSSTMAFC
jgi:hypothetical protein